MTAARSADDGLAQARQARPDLIIADGAMPGRTGYDLCAQVRADAALRGRPGLHPRLGQQPYDEARGHERRRRRPPAQALGHVGVHGEGLRGRRRSLRAACRAAPAARTTAASLPASAMEDDDYGEISIDSSGPATPLPIATGAPAVAAAPRAQPVVVRPASGSAARLRPGRCARR